MARDRGAPRAELPGRATARGEGQGGELLERYRTANTLGSGYARWLEGQFLDGADIDGLLRELRASYRLGAVRKLGYLGSRALA